MNLNIEPIANGAGERHTGPLFPEAAEREFAYQNETIRIEAVIHATPPGRADGKLNRSLPPPAYSEYALHIERHTGKALTLRLVGRRSDIVPQRMAEGRAVEEDVLMTTLDFAELCNRIFGPGAQVFHHTEAFPASIREAMKHAYENTGRTPDRAAETLPTLPCDPV